MHLVAAVGLALGSAAAYAAGAVLQQRLAATAGRLLQWSWLPAVALNLVGAGLHVLALLYGPLSLIQALGTVTLVLAMPASAALAGRPVTAAEWRAAAMVVTGLTTLLLLIRAPGPPRALTDPEVLAVVGVTVVSLSAVLTLARVANNPSTRSLWLATASGLTFGIGSALAQSATVQLSERGLGALLDPSMALGTLAIAFCSIAGLLLVQAAYRAGLGAPLAASTLVNAITAAVVGTAVLGEYYAAGSLGVQLALAAAGLAALGVVQLSAQVHLTTPNAGAGHRHDAPQDASRDTPV
jgi:hypothetical protein